MTRLTEHEAVAWSEAGPFDRLIWLMCKSCTARKIIHLLKLFPNSLYIRTISHCLLCIYCLSLKPAECVCLWVGAYTRVGARVDGPVWKGVALQQLLLNTTTRQFAKPSEFQSLLAVALLFIIVTCKIRLAVNLIFRFFQKNPNIHIWNCTPAKNVSWNNYASLIRLGSVPNTFICNVNKAVTP